MSLLRQYRRRFVITILYSLVMKTFLTTSPAWTKRLTRPPHFSLIVPFLFANSIPWTKQSSHLHSNPHDLSVDWRELNGEYVKCLMYETHSSFPAGINCRDVSLSMLFWPEAKATGSENARFSLWRSLHGNPKTKRLRSQRRERGQIESQGCNCRFQVVLFKSNFLS